MAPGSKIAVQEKRYRERYTLSTGFRKQHEFLHVDDVCTDIPKRLIVCCDGTWFAADKGEDNIPSNVAKIGRLVAAEGLGVRPLQNSQHQIVKVPQIVYYQSGVGTGNLTTINKNLQGAFGAGLDENVCTAYHFLCNNYCPGDELFFFGFSRGAYTARALAGFVATVGILPPGSMHYFSGMYEAYKTKGSKKFRDTAWYQDPENVVKNSLRTAHINIQFVGVWDTVGSLGIPESYVSKWTGANGSYKFYDTELHPKINKAAQALALDEHRGTFSPTLWFERDGDRYGWTSNLIQCWFPGYHSDIGGGTTNDQNDENSIDEISLAWMVDQVGDLLTWDEDEIKSWIKDQDPNRPKTYWKKNGEKIKIPNLPWGEGNITESAGLMYAPGFMGGRGSARTPGQYNYQGDLTSAVDDIDGETECDSETTAVAAKVGTFSKNDDTSKSILPDGVKKSGKKFFPTHEYIHPVVRYRTGQLKQKPKNLGSTPGYLWGSTPNTEYKTAALDKFETLKETEKDNFVYWKKPDPVNGDVIIREYQIPPQNVEGFHPYGLERLITPKAILDELDMDNNYVNGSLANGFK